MLHYIFAKMGDLPVGYRARLRDLTIGPVAWGLWSLTLHDGSTWAFLAMRDGEIIGWSCVTKEYDLNPMIGAYVVEAERGSGIGAMLVKSILTQLLTSGELNPGDTIVATTSRWPRYFELVEECGLVCREWE